MAKIIKIILLFSVFLVACNEVEKPSFEKEIEGKILKNGFVLVNLQQGCSSCYKFYNKLIYKNNLQERALVILGETLSHIEYYSKIINEYKDKIIIGNSGEIMKHFEVESDLFLLEIVDSEVKNVIYLDPYNYKTLLKKLKV